MASELMKEFEKKEEERKENPGTAYFRSYYNGFGLQEVECEDGITRNEFVYSGILYCFQGSAKKRAALKAVHILLALACAGLLVLIGMQNDNAVAASKVFAAPFFAVIVFTVLRIFTSILYILSPD